MAEVDQYALTTLENVREYLQTPATDTSKDNLLKRLINVASDAIEEHLNRKLKKREFTETHYLDSCSKNLFVEQFPIIKITSITDDGTALTDAELADCENRKVYIKLDSIRGGKIDVVYEAGYAAIQDDLEQACIMLVMYYYKMDVANFSTVFAESGAVFRPTNLPPHVAFLIKKYRKITL